ncbi:MAG: glycosyltransferase family 2 protein [Terriglobia bacterium]
MKCIFWGSALLIAYTFVGYPALLFLRSRWRPRPVLKAPILPSVSVVMAAHNEAEVLPAKLKSLAALDYPAERLEIIVTSDGSTDATEEIVAARTSERVRLVAHPRREGKASALNRGIQAAQGEIVLFTDARQLIAPDAVRQLVANFADPSVGCVSGELILSESDAVGSNNGFGLYWSLEKKIRQWESLTGSVIGATGALYAVRNDLLVPLPVGTILDDVYLPLHVARRRRRVVFEPMARVYDRVAPSQREFHRKVRTLFGNYQLVQLAPWLLTASNPVLWDYVSHKLSRLLAPFSLAALLISSLFLRTPLYEAALVVQVVFYGLAALTIFGRPRPAIVARLADAAAAFLVLNAAAAVAFYFFLRGKREVWVR